MSDTESFHNIYPNMAQQQYHHHHRSQFGDTTFTKLFVGGLAWETPPEEMRKYFEQFGDILEAVIITDKNTGKSKGYGFVTFSDEESARRACDEPNPVIDGRRANCNIASLGRTRPSPPRGGRAQGGGVLVPGAGPPSVAQPPSLLYHHHHPSYGYQTYTPDYGYHHQGTMYNPQVQVQVQVQQAQYYQQQQVYGTSSCNSTPYYYVQQAPRSAYSSPQLSAGPSYLYYPTTPIDVSFSGYPPPMRQQPFPSPTATDSQAQKRTSSESTVRVVVTSESSNSQGKN